MVRSVTGMTKICEKEIPFSYDRERELFTLHTGIKPVSIPAELDTIVGQAFGMETSGKFLYKLSVPLSNSCTVFEHEVIKQIANCDLRREVEYFIENYESGSKYTEMRLRFPELDYFLPSAKNAKPVEQDFVFSRCRVSVFSFDICCHDTIITVSLDRCSEAHSSVKASAETISEVTLKFPETDDLKYLYDLYFAVRGFFAFICNRRNIGLRNAILIGNYLKKSIKEHKIVDAIGYTEQKLFPSQKYLEPIEDAKQLKKVPNVALFASRLKDLFQLFFEEKNDDTTIVSESSIHPSFKYRNLIDLKQSLHITAAFEFYVRTLLPEISSQETLEFLKDIEALIDKYIEASTGKKKKKAKNFKKSLIPQVSLEEKVLSVYRGYADWQPLSPILSEWFADDVSVLASTVNLWRNELAHGKREYEPDKNVVIAVRLVEHMNYCIILRHVGYCDEEIKGILSKVLTR